MEHLTARRDGQPLTARELKQRRDAAAARRKNSPDRDRQTAFAAFRRAGLTGADIVRTKAGVAGATPEKHAKLLAAIRSMGWKVGPVEEDGSAVATLGGKKLRISAGPEGAFFDARGKAWDPRTHTLENGKAVKRTKK